MCLSLEQLNALKCQKKTLQSTPNVHLTTVLIKVDKRKLLITTIFINQAQ